MLGSGRGGMFKAEDHSAEYVSPYDVGGVRRFWNSYFSKVPGIYESLSIDLKFGWIQSEAGTLEQPADYGSVIYFFPSCSKNAAVLCVHRCQDTSLKKSLMEGIMCMMESFSGCLWSTSLPEHVPIPEFPVPGS